MKKRRSHGLEGLQDDTEGMEGYKRTEVGVIPDDWECQRLSTLTSLPIQNGIFNDPAKKGRGCKLINVGDLYSAIPIDIKSLELFDANKDELTRFGVTHGDVFFTRSSLTPDGIAHCNIYKKEENEDLVFDCHIIRVRANTNKIDPFFLFRYCTASLARKYLVAHAKTTTMTTIDQGVIASLPILVPPPPEQEAIALSLSDTDALIAVCDRAITKKRNIKQGAMQQLLTGKKRLPGFSGEWEVKKLEKVAPLQRGFDLPTSQLIKGNYPVVYSNGILNFHNKYQAKAPGVVTGRSGTIGKVNFVETDYWPHNTSLWVTDFKGSSPKFIYYLYVFIGLERFGTGSGVPTLNRNDVHAFQISLPPTEEEQEAIAQIISDMDAEIAVLEKKRDKYKAIKQGMMQELLTGKTRLNT